MVVVYSILLAVGFVGLLVVVMGGALAENIDRPDRDPGFRLGERGRMALGALLGFSMGGMAAEFSPMGFSWQVALLVALAAGAVGVAWARYASRLSEPG